jgi:hypothetical protein
MGLEVIEAALKTLVDFPGHVGFFGGEPTIHPQFAEACALLRKYVWVKARREIWTSGVNWEKYKDVIDETFYPELISFNDHSKPMECWHQPNNIAADEVFNGGVTGNAGLDSQLMWKCVDNCWIQNRWSPVINKAGAFFCETAGARAIIMRGPAGLPVVPGWWRRPINDYAIQMQYLCTKCSSCLPMPMKVNSYQNFDEVSPGNLELLRQLHSPKVQDGRVAVVDLDSLREYYKGHDFTPNPDYYMRGSFLDFPEWTPWKYRSETKNQPDGTERKVADIVKEQRGAHE